MPISSRLAELGELVSRGGRMAREIRGDGIARELKGDGSIVTAADRAVETMLREELVKLVPGTDVWGEEFGRRDAGPNGLWVVDPVDGTSNFSYGSPLWGVSAALVQGDHIAMGAICLPELGELYLGERGAGAYRNGLALPQIPPGPIRPEQLVSYSDGLLRSVGQKPIPGKMRLSGAAVVDGTFTVCQRFRGIIGYKEHLWDIGAYVLMGLELGADVRYADGSPFLIEGLMGPEKISKPWIMFPRDSGFYL